MENSGERKNEVILSIPIRKDVFDKAEELLETLGFKREEQEKFFETLIERALEDLKGTLDKAGLTENSNRKTESRIRWLKELENWADKNTGGRNV